MGKVSQLVSVAQSFQLEHQQHALCCLFQGTPLQSFLKAIFLLVYPGTWQWQRLLLLGQLAPCATFSVHSDWESIHATIYAKNDVQVPGRDAISFSLLVRAVSPPIYSSLPLSLSLWAWLACRLLSRFLCLSLSLYRKLEYILNQKFRKCRSKNNSVHRNEKFLFVLNWLRWTPKLLLLMLYKTRVAIRFRAKNNPHYALTDYPKFCIGVLWCGRTGGVRSRD